MRLGVMGTNRGGRWRPDLATTAPVRVHVAIPRGNDLGYTSRFRAARTWVYHRRVPVLRCQKCDQAYDVPAAVAVRLPSALARCVCGELLIGLREVLAARVAAGNAVDELDLAPYRIDPAADETRFGPPEPEAQRALRMRSVRVIARANEATIEKIFTAPDAASDFMMGLRTAQILLDREGLHT